MQRFILIRVGFFFRPCMKSNPNMFSTKRLCSLLSVLCDALLDFNEKESERQGAVWLRAKHYVPADMRNKYN